jgi:hypothetical protein
MPARVRLAAPAADLRLRPSEALAGPQCSQNADPDLSAGTELFTGMRMPRPV